jgi:hypothetical protein
MMMFFSFFGLLRPQESRPCSIPLVSANSDPPSPFYFQLFFF